MYALGRHLILDLQECNQTVLDDVGFLRDCLHQAAVRCGATVVGQSFYHFSPHGVSGVVNIAESHISIHTWPEYRYAAVDVFTCGETVVPEEAASLIAERVEAGNRSLIEMRRGMVAQNVVAGASP